MQNARLDEAQAGIKIARRNVNYLRCANDTTLTAKREEELKSPSMKARASLVSQRVKRLPTMQETRLRSLGQEDPLEKEMATHSSTLAWKIPWTEDPGGLQSMGSQRVGHD